MVFQSGTVKTTNGSPTGGLPYSGGDVFSSEDIIIAPDAAKEITFEYSVTGDNVQLPNGFVAQTGDTVHLTLAEVEAIHRDLGAGVLTEVAVDDLTVARGSTPWRDVNGGISEAPESEETVQSVVV